MNQARDTLVALHRAALDAVDGEAAVRRWLQANPLPGSWWLLAVGKAAPTMARGARAVLGERLVGGLVIARTGSEDPQLARAPGFHCLTGSHPYPDQRSLEAGRAAICFVDDAPADARFLVLVSGGASALMEDLGPGGDADALAELNRRLLADGLAIDAVNRVRKRVSRIKAGRLGRRLRGRRACQLIISDVPGDDPAVIGSAPLVAAPATADGPLPGRYRGLVAEAEPPPTPGDPSLAGIETHIVACNADARGAVLREAAARGFPIHAHDAEPLAGDAMALGRRLAATLIDAAPGVHVWGGEPTVTLPPYPGEGGRMQALALSAARRLAGRRDVALLAAGTDGADGPGEAAGAVVDGGTLARGAHAGGDAATALAVADAGRFLGRSGDLLRTGPTGTNVMDLVIGWRGGGDG